MDNHQSVEAEIETWKCVISSLLLFCKFNKGLNVNEGLTLRDVKKLISDLMCSKTTDNQNFESVIEASFDNIPITDSTYSLESWKDQISNCQRTIFDLLIFLKISGAANCEYMPALNNLKSLITEIAVGDPQIEEHAQDNGRNVQRVASETRAPTWIPTCTLNNEQDCGCSNQLTKKYHCSECDKAYRSTSSMLRHKKVNHIQTEEERPQCPLCEHRFSRMESLRYHLHFVEHLKAAEMSAIIESVEEKVRVARINRNKLSR